MRRPSFPPAQLLAGFSLLVVLNPVSSIAQETVQDKALFNWAEYAYPRFFSPAGAPTEVVQGYVTRHYTGSNTYLGLRDGTVYASGAPFVNFPDLGAGIRSLGLLSSFTTSMSADGFGVASGEKLLISEAVSKDVSGGADWFELYNAGSTSVNLASYQVNDDGADHPLRALPNMALAPGEYFVVTASEKAVSGVAAQVAFNLGDSDSVLLFKQGVLMDSLVWDNSESEYGNSFGHYPAPLAKAKTIVPTPGTANKASPGWTRNDLGSVGTLKSAGVHDISLTLDQAAYVKMIETYRSTREKTWIEGTVTIDGTTYTQVGLRLKGNSSLGSVTTSSPPASVPWLVKLDKINKEQNHQGMEEFVVRSNSSKTALNEAVALELLELAGLATQDAIEVRLSVNGSAQVLRLIVESPDGEWMREEFAATGALYKAESTGDYSYRGEDPASYDEVFDQEAGDDNADLTPLIGFLKFLNQSDDSTFAAELPTRLNVDAFASYLAMQDLLNNFDDIDGPGNNSYLYYDTVAKQFTIVPWDYNLAFGSNVGGGGAGGFTRPTDGTMPTFPAGGATPPIGGNQQTPPTGGANGGVFIPGGGMVPGQGGAGGPTGRSNILVTRFQANSQWSALYQQKLVSLRRKLYGSGVATELLTLWSAIANESGLVDATTLNTEKERDLALLQLMAMDSRRSMNNALALQRMATILEPTQPATQTLQQIIGLLRIFSKHQLHEVGELSLMSRFDTKYLLPVHHLEAFLRHVRGDYSLLDIDGNTVHGYQTLYFDTPEFKYYFAHHNARSPRVKVRCRTYVDSGRCYLEMKSKNNKGRTEKKRVAVPAGITDSGVRTLLRQQPFEQQTAEGLQSCVNVGYRRLSLWSRQHGERVSIDVGLTARRHGESGGFSMDDIAVVEVKQSSINRLSPARTVLRQLHLRPLSFSKYCIACALLYPQELRSNKFRKLLLQLNPFLDRQQQELLHASF